MSKVRTCIRSLHEPSTILNHNKVQKFICSMVMYNLSQLNASLPKKILKPKPTHKNIFQQVEQKIPKTPKNHR